MQARSKPAARPQRSKVRPDLCCGLRHGLLGHQLLRSSPGLPDPDPENCAKPARTPERALLRNCGPGFEESGRFKGCPFARGSAESWPSPRLPRSGSSTPTWLTKGTRRPWQSRSKSAPTTPRGRRAPFAGKASIRKRRRSSCAGVRAAGRRVLFTCRVWRLFRARRFSIGRRVARASNDTTASCFARSGGRAGRRTGVDRTLPGFE